ncbi:phosphonates import ATP-binding protein PhnC [Marinobacterium nitratireducens]|uniref:Phosphonates import ATP-binding protein PhnC n=1 Tax=Marinobacterium nitratireducens TaxID=518897 RepID=A0A918DNJ5_9GAMM|nr:ATP-binding cassette domain-containing protein [Marinobacterium nitratireducens]GGO77005.1 phosphonates import ATP-binding protein PhnC [Marinobacterium nitratireducens]
MSDGKRGPALFSLSAQSLSYGRTRVLDSISLSIRRGERVALLGPSGAGKSTLLNLLYGQQAASTALQPQGGGIVDLLSVYQNIFIGALDRVGNLPALWNLLRPLPSHRRDITELTRRLGLEEQLWQSADRLSGGQRQRVAIGRALYRRQPIFLGDEPVSSVDPLQADALLKHLLAEHETAVVSLHNRQQALDHFDRILVLREGRICCDCAAAELSAAALDQFYQQDGTPEAGEPAPESDGWVIRTS